jgi:uncharacterized membrane protein YraQ (UPF0718 family)
VVVITAAAVVAAVAVAVAIAIAMRTIVRANNNNGDIHPALLPAFSVGQMPHDKNSEPAQEQRTTTPMPAQA